MNAEKVTAAIREIEKAEKALKWFEECGRKIEPEHVSFEATFYLRGSCPGHFQAEEMVAAHAKLAIQDIITAATEDCRNTISLRKSEIVEEVVGK